MASTKKHPLFTGDPERLLAKLRGAGGLLEKYRDEFHQRLLLDPAMRSNIVFLPALLTGEGMDDARGALRQYWEALAREDAAWDVQFHTWCRSGTVLRKAVFFDWLACSGAWSDDEMAAAAESFLGYAFKNAYTVLLSRTRTSNNQALAMALNCAVIGYLFGMKHRRHGTGRFLFDYGVRRLVDLIGLFPADGYGGEGSTYTSAVNTPLAYWINEFFRQALGEEWLDKPFSPNNTTLRSILEMEQRLVSPGGWMPPWDHYGWSKPCNASPFAYLARVLHRPEYLSMIPAFNLWGGGGSLAWGHDDPLWTLVWWPEAFKDFNGTEPPAGLFGWFLPRTGAALDDATHKARLMQVWDACADGIAGVCRIQSNPNHIMFDYAGEPVFQDGVAGAGKSPWGFTADQIFTGMKKEQRDRYVNYVLGNNTGQSNLQDLLDVLSTGMTGASNAIIVDEEPWHWPGSRCVGAPAAYIRENGLQAVAADCADFYKSRYDVERALRTSLWSDEGFGLVADSLQAGSAHSWRWQVHLRPDVTLVGDTARIALPGGRHVLLAWEHGPTARLSPLENFPKTQECRCVRLELLLERTATAEFNVLIAPEAKSASIRRLGPNRVEVVIDGVRREVALPRPGRLDVVPDVHELPDIAGDWEKLPELDACLKKTLGCSEPDVPALLPESPGLLPALDACLAQLTATGLNMDLLRKALHHPRWPVRAAAADVLGRRGVSSEAPVLRRMLADEHAISAGELYPPTDAAPGARTTEDLGKRWRLKAALVVALGRMKDEAAVPVMHGILKDGYDFHAVYSVIAQALGRIGGSAAIEALRLAQNEQEHNTTVRTQKAMLKLTEQQKRGK